MLSMLSIISYVGLSIFVYICFCFMIAVNKKRADIADIAWGPGFALFAWISMALSHTTLYGTTINILITIWALRLAFHIYNRHRLREEDFRYQILKNKWKHHFYFRLFCDVFLLQGLILYIIALPILWVHTHPVELSQSILWIALPLWFCGFMIELVADWQLTSFKQDPLNIGKILTKGLWSYVRHPNYLGELMQWWAIWLFAASLPYGWALIISPLLLTFLIIHVSGIKPVEKRLKKNPIFDAYLKNTPSLIHPALANWIMYYLAWYVLIIYGPKNNYLLASASIIVYLVLQMWIFKKLDRKSFRICIPIALLALALGLVQEFAFIHFHILSYLSNSPLPPYWIGALYFIFSLTLNSSLLFLSKNLTLTFFLGGFGGLVSYLSGEKLGIVLISSPLSYPIIFFCWGIYLTVLVFINRSLKKILFKSDR